MIKTNKPVKKLNSYLYSSPVRIKNLFIVACQNQHLIFKPPVKKQPFFNKLSHNQQAGQNN